MNVEPAVNNTNCSDVQSINDTSCTALIIKDDNYTVTLSNDDEDNDDIRLDNPSKIIIDCEFCNSKQNEGTRDSSLLSYILSAQPLAVEVKYPTARGSHTVVLSLHSECDRNFTVELSFGVREKDSEDKCLPMQNETATIFPGTSVPLNINITDLPLGRNQQYCFTVSKLNIERGK